MLFFPKRPVLLLAFFSLRRIVGLRQSQSTKSSRRFVSYMAYFTRPYRLELLSNAQIPFIRSMKVSLWHFVPFRAFVQRVNCNDDEPAKVATLLWFCSRSWYPWQTAWIQSSCLQMMPLLLPGVTRVCQIIGSQLRTQPSWPLVSVGRLSLSHSNRASKGFGTGPAQIWGWCSWDSEGKPEYQIIFRGTQNLHTFICLCVFLLSEVPCDWTSSFLYQ